MQRDQGQNEYAPFSSAKFKLIFTEYIPSFGIYFKWNLCIV